ncbi:MAG: hypothetical protein R3B91_00945 [Planctomycetaceae bacterium]
MTMEKNDHGAAVYILSLEGIRPPGVVVAEQKISDTVRQLHRYS